MCVSYEKRDWVSCLLDHSFAVSGHRVGIEGIAVCCNFIPFHAWNTEFLTSYFTEIDLMDIWEQEFDALLKHPEPPSLSRIKLVRACFLSYLVFWWLHLPDVVLSWNGLHWWNQKNLSSLKTYGMTSHLIEAYSLSCVCIVRRTSQRNGKRRTWHVTYCSLKFTWQTTNQCQIIIVPLDGGQRNASAPKPLFSAHFKALLYPLSTWWAVAHAARLQKHTVFCSKSASPKRFWSIRTHSDKFLCDRGLNVNF